jgi:hypothetical protein
MSDKYQLTIRRTNQRMLWVLRLIAAKQYQFTLAWDEEDVDAFVATFPESRKGTKVYTMGANSCAMLNQAARRGLELGFLKSGSASNQYARSYNQRTWVRTWRITPEGKDYIHFVDAQVGSALAGGKG